MSRRNKWLLATAFLIVAGGLVTVRFFRPFQVVAAKPEQNVPVQVYGLGTLEAHTISKVGFKISGTLVSLEVDQGDRVRKGQVLARLDPTEQESRVLKAAVDVEKARAAILVAKAGEERARFNLKHRERMDQRRQPLLQKGFVSLEDADEKRVGAELARAELKLSAGEAVAAEAALKYAEAQLKLEKVLLSQHTLIAPFDGQIVSRHKELGSVQVSNEPLFTLVDPNTIWARVYVDEGSAGGLKVGQRAEIRLRSEKSKSFPGHIARVDIESDRASEERCIHITFDTAPEEYHLGEQTEAIITTAVLEKGWFLPATAIKDLNGSAGKVWSLKGGKLDLHKIFLGYRLLDGRYQILGINQDCMPIAGFPANAREGARAVVMEESPQ